MSNKGKCSFKDLQGVKIARIATVPFFLVSQLKGQAEYLRDLGMEVALVSSSGPELAQLELSEKLTLEVIELSRGVDGFKDLLALFKLFHFFRKKKFDIVHSTTPKAGLLTAIAAFFARIPVRLHTFTGQPWTTMGNPMRFVARSCDRLIGALSTKCFADSPSQRDFLVKEKIIAADKIAVIGNGSLAGVDMQRFSPDRYRPADRDNLMRELRIPPDAKVLVFIGRITKDKGMRELLSAFRRVANLGYDVDLLLIGPSDAECGGSVTISMDELNQHPRVHWIGYSNTPQKYLAISDLLCLPSYREGFGTVVIEAAAMGIPTLGTKIYGLQDAVENGVTGLLFEPRDEEALFNGLLYLLDSPEVVNRMGAEALRRCSKYFDAAVVNRKLAETYLQLLLDVNNRGQ